VVINIKIAAPLAGMLPAGRAPGQQEKCQQQGQFLHGATFLVVESQAGCHDDLTAKINIDSNYNQDFSCQQILLDTFTVAWSKLPSLHQFSLTEKERER
jgi:hypothetical protein